MHINCFILFALKQLHKDGTVITEDRTMHINPLTPELNPSTQRCLPRFFFLEGGGNF
jgi:hypothetical protein